MKFPSLSLFLFTFCLATFAKPPAQASKVNDVLTNLQESWNSTGSYQADFKQVIFAKRLGTREESTGTLTVVKPGKLRWESKTDNNIQILNGKRFTNIKENKRRKTRVVDVYSDISKQIDIKMLNFLAGKAQFKEWYHTEIVSEDTEKIELKLTPRSNKAAGKDDTYIAEFEKKGYMLRALTNETGDSRVRIDFSNIKTGKELQLDEKLFEYKPDPKDIVHNQ
jgi:outer membrane lipoprotein-sorting protein